MGSTRDSIRFRSPPLGPALGMVFAAFCLYGIIQAVRLQQPTAIGLFFVGLAVAIVVTRLLATYLDVTPEGLAWPNPWTTLKGPRVAWKDIESIRLEFHSVSRWPTLLVTCHDRSRIAIPVPGVVRRQRDEIVAQIQERLASYRGGDPS